MPKPTSALASKNRSVLLTFLRNALALIMRPKTLNIMINGAVLYNISIFITYDVGIYINKYILKTCLCFVNDMSTYPH